MSFGGGSADYRINYIITTSTQGAGAGPINQVAAATDKLGTSSMSAAKAQEKLTAAQNKVQQANLGVSKAAKGLTFGILGITTAGAEMVGMLSMWQQTQIGVKEAQQNLNQALEEHGKGSSEAKQATQELAKANRWAAMTQRNLMLSMFDMIPFIALTINGLAKLKTALAAKAAAAKELAMVNSTLTRSELGLAATTKATGASMLLNANGMNVASKSALGFRGTLTAVGTAATGLLIKLAPLLAILGGLALATAAYANNWLGLRSVFDSVGVAIGNAIPQLKGFLETIKAVADKLGKGDIQGAIDVLMQKVTGETALTQISKQDEKAAKELEELYNRVRESALQLFDDLAHMDKGERKEALFDLGIKGGAKKRFKETLDEYEKFSDGLTNFSNAVKVAGVSTTLQEYGVDIPNSMFKKIEFTWEDRFRDMSDMFGDSKISGVFTNLADALEKDAKKNGGKNLQEIVAKFLEGPDGAQLLDLARKLGFTEFVEFATFIMDEEERKFMDRARELGTKVSEWYKNIKPNPNAVIHTTPEQMMKDAEKLPEYFKNQFPSTYGLKEMKLTPVTQDVKLNITDSAGNTFGATGSVVAAGAGAVGAAAQAVLKTLFNAGAWDTAIRQNILPMAQGVLTNVWNRFVEAIGINTIQPVLDFNAGFNTQVDVILRSLFNAGQWAKATIAFFSGGAIAQGILTQIWNEFAKAVGINTIQPVIDMAAAIDAGAKGLLNSFFNAGMWHDRIKNYFDTGVAVLGILTDLWNQFVAKITETATNSFAGQGIKVITDAITKILQPAEGATTVIPFDFTVQPQYTIAEPTPKKSMIIGEGSRFGKAGTLFPNSLTQWAKNVQIPAISADVPIDPKKIIINPPTGQNATPTITGPNGITPSFTTPSATITPASATVDISSSVKTVSDNPGKEGSGIPGSWGPAYALYIDYPGTAVVSPQTVAFDITDADLAVGVTTFQAIAVEADKTKQFVVNAYNELAATLAELFATTSQKWSEKSAEIGNNAIAAREAVTNEFNELVATLFELFDTTLNDWSDTMAEVAQNAADASQGIINEFESAMEGIIDAADDMLGEWSNTMDDMVQAAEDAADDIESALASIPDETVKINYETSGKPQAHGTSGTWVHKPTTFLAGEQGAEFVQVTRAHSKPSVTGGDGEGGGDISTTFNGTINLKISGNEIINPTKLSQKIKMTVGENMDRFG